MKIVEIESNGNWLGVKKACFTTIDKNTTKEPTSKWKRDILKSEHSPIRKLIISLKMEGIKSWVSVHLVRHKFGIEHFVSTRRSDRTGVDRNALRQDELVNHEICLNAQSAITISRKRLCKQASKETQEAWSQVIDAIKTVEPELASLCVPECVYRGHCPEFYPCGYNNTNEYKVALESYQAR